MRRFVLFAIVIAFLLPAAGQLASAPSTGDGQLVLAAAKHKKKAKKKDEYLKAAPRA